MRPSLLAPAHEEFQQPQHGVEIELRPFHGPDFGVRATVSAVTSSALGVEVGKGGIVRDCPVIVACLAALGALPNLGLSLVS